MRRKTKNSIRYTENAAAWLFNSPYVLYSVIFLFIPLGWAAWLAITDWNLMTADYNIVGIKNIMNLFTDQKVRSAFLNAYKYLVPIVVLCFVVGLLIAELVSKQHKKIKGILAVMFFIPYLTSGVATSVMVKHVFSYNSALNMTLREFGIDINWLRSNYAFWILIAMIIWKMSGYYALFILSGIESVPKDVYEASEVDGCTGAQKFFRITLPMITPTLTSVIVLAAGLAFQVFSEPFLLTGGGPKMATTTWLLEIYNTSFVGFRAGYGAAMAIVNAVQIFITIQLISWIMNKINVRFGW